MNRQQRRQMMRRQEVEQKYLRAIERRQERIDDRTLEAYHICIALALHNIYGWQHHGIEKVIHEFNRVLGSIDGEKVTYETLRKELLAKTGIEIAWAEDIESGKT